MLKALIEKGGCSIHGIFPEYKDQKGAYRLLKNEKVTEELLIQSLQSDCSSRVSDKSLLVYCDTTALNYESQKGRITNFEGLGRVGTVNGKKICGVHIHPLLVEDENTGQVYGISDVKIIARPMVNKWNTPKKKGKNRNVAIEEKESFKWIGPCLSSRDEILKDSKHMTFVMDREGDITDVFYRIPNKKTDLVIRSQHNRFVLDCTGNKLKLHDHINSEEIKCKYSIDLEKFNNGNSSIEVGVKWGKIKLRPGKEYRHLDSTSISYVEVKQLDSKTKDSIHWILLTTRKVESNQEALQVIKTYQKRWNIEVYFKLLKSDGFNIEKTELTTGKGIRKLTLITMKASIKIMQLKSARTGETELQTEDVFDKNEILLLKKLNTKYEGSTEKQQNPYTETHLAWASWVIARMGGWSEYYNKKRPPGNKSFIKGLERFEFIKNCADVFD